MLTIKKRPLYQEPAILAGLFFVSLVGSAVAMSAIDPKSDTASRNVKVSSSEHRSDENQVAKTDRTAESDQDSSSSDGKPAESREHIESNLQPSSTHNQSTESHSTSTAADSSPTHRNDSSTTPDEATDEKQDDGILIKILPITILGQ